MAPTPRTNADQQPIRGTRAIRSGIRLFAALALSLTTGACSTVEATWRYIFAPGPNFGQPGYVKGFLGAVVADEPRAALAGKDILSGGGNAADAAVAVGLALAVTLPSRAGLGGGGACLVYTADRRGPTAGAPESILFLPPPATSIGGGDRRAAVPMLARGMFLLHARHGRQPFESLITVPEQLARFGVPVSRAFARDLALVARPLFADPAARAVFGASGAPLVPGQGLVQPALAGTLAQLRVSGVGDLHQGGLARRIEAESPQAGVPIGIADLRAALPSLSPAIVVPFGNDKAAFVTTDGGLAAASGFMALRGRSPDLTKATARSLAAAMRWRESGGRAGGVTAEEVLNTDFAMPTAVPLYPASTSFVTLDPSGNAVVCALTLNNLFGTGRMLPGLGFIAAASPAAKTPPLLPGGLVWNEDNHAFRAAAGGSGQAGAPLAAALALSNAARSTQPMPNLVPDPGRANVIACANYLPGPESSCGAAADPREGGIAAGAN